MLSTPLLGVGDGQRGVGGSLSATTRLSRDLARRLPTKSGSTVETLGPEVESKRSFAMSRSIDNGSTGQVRRGWEIVSALHVISSVNDEIFFEGSIKRKAYGGSQFKNKLSEF